MDWSISRFHTRQLEWRRKEWYRYLMLSFFIVALISFYGLVMSGILLPCSIYGGFPDFTVTYGLGLTTVMPSGI